MKVFTIYGHGGYLGHETWNIYIYFVSAFPRRLHIKRKRSLKMMVIYIDVYSSGAGADNPLWSKFFNNTF